MLTSPFAVPILSLTSGLYIIQIVWVVIKRDFRKESLWHWLLIFLGVSFFWSTLITLLHAGVLPDSLFRVIGNFGILLITFSLLVITHTALQNIKQLLLWIILDGIWLGWMVGGELGLFRNWVKTSLGVLALGWTITMVGIALSIIKARRNHAAPALRARTYYWSIGVIIIAIGSVVFMGEQLVAGVFIMALGSLVITTTSLRPYMPDIRQMEQGVLNYLVMTILTALVLIIGAIGIASFLIQAQLEHSPLLIGAVIAFLLAALLAPLWNVSNSIAKRLLPQGQYNSERILREFSQSVSNVLDPEKLSTITIHLITSGMDITHGHLFLIEQETEEGIMRYRLRSSKGLGTELQEVGLIAYDSPIVDYFKQECHPLRQVELDLQPRFRDCDPNEIAWLKSLKSEIYIPVYAKEEWIGLFALGPKKNGLPYLEKDLTILSILADHTSVALQNGKLVESLMRVNNEFRRAYAAMDQANRHLKKVNTQLEGLDRTKSEFINVASHELGTPLKELRVYVETLLEDPTIQENPAQARMVDGIYAGIMRMNDIVNSMLDIASIDTQTMELRLEHVSISTLIHTIQKSLANAVMERNLTLEATNLSDLPPVDGDSEALYKVFYQVIINAIKYTPDGGNVSVTGVPVSAGQLGLIRGGIEILVSDTGIGISHDNLELIFTKFFKTGSLELAPTGKTKFKAPGPGLGLAIAKGIVEAHRGKIWAESPGYDEENCPGSTIHIVLPLHFKSQPIETDK